MTADASIGSQLQSYLGRTLRTFPGVAVSTELGSIGASVAALELKGEFGGRFGVAASLMVSQDSAPSQHSLLAPSLVELCSRLAVEIDQTAIEPAREAWRARLGRVPTVRPESQSPGSKRSRS